jgi:hypothetical protein
MRPHWLNVPAATVNRFTGRNGIGHFVMAITGSMTALILKRARASRSSGEWKDEDYDVLADGKVVGRIMEEGSRFGPPELRWDGRSRRSCRHRRRRTAPPRRWTRQSRSFGRPGRRRRLARDYEAIAKS